MSNRIVIEPGAKAKHYWKDIWNYRGLFYFLAWRDVLVRYKQTAIGLAWSIIKPLFTILVMWFIGWLFSSQVPVGVPRILLVSAAALPWQFFSGAFSEISNSLVTNSNLLTKVYFPRLIVPLSTIIVALIDFCISLALLVVIMCFYRFVPDWKILFLPLFLLLAIIIAIGTGLFIGALNVKYRDFRIIVPFIVQIGLYISPVAFSSDYIYNSSRIPEALKFVYSLNPMVSVIDGFRWCIIGSNSTIYLPGFLISIVVSFFFLIIGIWYFRKTEHSFADVI
ncbi:MAG TPA: ABC transporter permease [Bacteroidia bacterium]|nr:ABC transporter permease [Bacteroidia bacterium]